MNEDDVKAVMKYQRLFPELLKDEEGFCVNGRVLWEQLEKPYGGYATWIKQRVLKQGWKKNSDYSSLMKSQKRGVGGTISKEYYFTIEMAKHVAMMENTECGHLVRTYFIKMEKAIKGYQDHEAIRHPEKAGFKEMCKYIKQQYIENNGKSPIGKSIYANNADMINVALLGKTAQQIKDSLDIADTETRENLSIETNRAIYDLQQLNINLILSNIDFSTREKMINDTCRFRYSNLKNNVYKELDIAA